MLSNSKIQNCGSDWNSSIVGLKLFQLDTGLGLETHFLVVYFRQKVGHGTCRSNVHGTGTIMGLPPEFPLIRLYMTIINILYLWNYL